MMNLGPKGAALIKSFEQLRLKAYRNFPGEPWTCGWGHTGKDVTATTTCTPQQADLWFECDTAGAVLAVNRSLVDSILEQNEFDAIVAFTYNVGIAAEAHSTLIKLVNQSCYNAAAEEFLKWNHDNGVVVPGLTRRREAERALFLSQEDA